jgi:hypothetical protein
MARTRRSEHGFERDSAPAVRGGLFLTPLYALRAADFDSNFLQNIANRENGWQTFGAVGIRERSGC